MTKRSVIAGLGAVLALALAGRAYSQPIPLQPKNFIYTSKVPGQEGRQIKYTVTGNPDGAVIETNNPDVRHLQLGSRFYDIDNDGKFGKAELIAMMNGIRIFDDVKFDEQIKAASGIAETNPEQFYAYVNSKIKEMQDAQNTRDSAQDTRITGYEGRVNSLEGKTGSYATLVQLTQYSQEAKEALAELEERFNAYISSASRNAVPATPSSQQMNAPGVTKKQQKELSNVYNKLEIPKTGSPFYDIDSDDKLGRGELETIPKTQTPAQVEGLTGMSIDTDTSVPKKSTHKPEYDNAREVTEIYLAGNATAEEIEQAKKDAEARAFDFAKARENLRIENEFHREDIKNGQFRSVPTEPQFNDLTGNYRGHPIEIKRGLQRAQYEKGFGVGLVLGASGSLVNPSLNAIIGVRLGNPDGLFNLEILGSYGRGFNETSKVINPTSASGLYSIEEISKINKQLIGGDLEVLIGEEKAKIGIGFGYRLHSWQELKHIESWLRDVQRRTGDSLEESLEHILRGFIGIDIRLSEKIRQELGFGFMHNLTTGITSPTVDVKTAINIVKTQGK